jgi:hypothetical protein
MTPEEAELTELGARVLVTHFTGDRPAVEDQELAELGGNVSKVADAFTYVAI